MMQQSHELQNRIIGGVAALALVLLTGCATRAPERLADQSTQAVLWMQNAGEYQALCYQAYNQARQIVDQAKDDASGPWAVVVDLDETMLDNSPYAGWTMSQGLSYEPVTWDAWCRSMTTPAIPGSVEFANYVTAQGGALFYVSNRLHQTFEATQENLQQLGYPNVTAQTLLLRKTTSDKQPRFQGIADAGYTIVLMLGDNLNDFPEMGTRHQATAERNAIVAQNQSAFGQRFILLPNPSYGDWEDGLASDYRKLSAEEKLKLRRQRLKAWDGQ